MPLTSADRPLLLVLSLEAADDIFVLLCLPHPVVSAEFLFPIRNRTSNILSNMYQIQVKMANTFSSHAAQALGYHVETVQFLRKPIRMRPCKSDMNYHTRQLPTIRPEV